MSLLNVRYSQISLLSIPFSTNSYEHEISHSAFNVSCFWCHVRFPLLWLTVLDLYVFVGPTFFSNLIFVYSCFHYVLWTWNFSPHLQRVVFLISCAFPSTLAYSFGFVCLFWLKIFQKSFVSYECLMKTWVPASTINVFFLFGFIGVSLYVGLQISICMSFLYSRFLKNRCVVLIVSWKRGFPLPPSSCRVFDIISVSLYFCLPIWMCMSFVNLFFS